MPTRQTDISTLKELCRAPVGLASARRVDRFGFGIAGLDERLSLPCARLHEIFTGEADDAGAALAFALMTALRVREEGKPIFWVSEERSARDLGRLYPPGFAELGISPDEIVQIEAPDRLAALRALVDILRCGAVGAAVLAFAGGNAMPDLTASRRLTLAAEHHGVPAIMACLDAVAGPSAAYSRWRVRSASSHPLEADAPGHPTFDLELLRHRGGIAGLNVRLEWNRDELCFREPALSGALLPIPGHGPAWSRTNEALRRTA